MVSAFVSQRSLPGLSLKTFKLTPHSMNYATVYQDIGELLNKYYFECTHTHIRARKKTLLEDADMMSQNLV